MTHKLTIERAVKFRIYPNKRTQHFFHKTFGCARKLYNLLVEEIDKEQAAYKAFKEDTDNQSETFHYQWTKPSEAKKEYAYLKEPDSLALCNAQLNFERAFRDYLSGSKGKPKYKKKSVYPRTYTTNNQTMQNGSDTIYIYPDKTSKTGWFLHLPKLTKRNGGDVPILVHRAFAERVRNVTIEYTASGQWYASLGYQTTVEVTTDEDILEGLKSLTEDELCAKIFGGDLGLSTFLTGTDGSEYNFPDAAGFKQLEDKLRRETRKLGLQRKRLLAEKRDLKDCRNYQKQRRRVACLYAKLKRKRHDFLHKLSRELVNNHDFLAFEKLDVAGMLRSSRNSKAIASVAWSSFLAYVKYKCEEAGKIFVQVDQLFPSTQLCSACGAKTGPKGEDDLGVREWVCSECGAAHDRDLNAAWNILAEALRLKGKSSNEWLGVLSRVGAHAGLAL